MLGYNESNIIFQQHLCKLGQLWRSNGRNSQVFEINLWSPHFRTFCELVEGEENKLTTFSTWTILLGCNESNIIFQQHLCKLGQLRRSNGRNSQVFERNLWSPHFRTFCELVEGEENKLTTFSTWTILLGCNESLLIPGHYKETLAPTRELLSSIRQLREREHCSVAQIQRSNSQVLGQAMKKRPTGHYKKYSHFKGRDTPAAGWGAVSLIRQLREREHCLLL